MHFPAYWWSSTQASLRPQTDPQNLPPKPKHYGTVTLGSEGCEEHFGRATSAGAAVDHLGMSVLRDATYATLGTRASLRGPEPLDRTLRSPGTGLRAPDAQTCVHAFAYFRAAEAVPCLLSSLFDFLGHIQGSVCETGLFRGVFWLYRIFFIFPKLYYIGGHAHIRARCESKRKLADSGPPPLCSSYGLKPCH